MGFIYSFLTVFLLTLNLASDIPYTELEQAFSSGNAQAISSMGKEKMLISILDKEGAYSQSQATQVLKDFFTKKPVSSFKFTFKGKETNDGSFAIGEYVSKQDNFRVTVQFKKLNQQFKIERLTIEAD
jgi:hypothetical protein